MDARKNTMFLLIILLLGCSQRSARQKLQDFINDPDNKIIQSIRIGNVTMISKWIPFYPQLTNAAEKDRNEPAEEDYYYFHVRLENPSTEKPVKEKIMYLDFDIQQDFTLVHGTDSLAPVICQKIEQGVSGRYQYLVAFEKHHPGQTQPDFVLLYKDKIFGIGTVAFVYRKEITQKVPILKRPDVP